MQASMNREAVSRSIRACREDIVMLNSAASVASNPAHRSRLHQQVCRHSRSLRELELSLASLREAHVVRNRFSAWVCDLWQCDWCGLARSAKRYTKRYRVVVHRVELRGLPGSASDGSPEFAYDLCEASLHSASHAMDQRSSNW